MEKISFIADNSHVRTSGRTYFRNDILYLGYTASFVEFGFTGTYASAELWSDLTPSEEIFRAWAVVFINGKAVKHFKLDETTAEYELFSAEAPETVTIRLMKVSEAAFAKMGIKKITVCGENVHPTSVRSERRIEFVGDSITCGYGIDGVWNKDQFSTETENPLKGFALKTAEICGAEHQFISWSGIGVYSRWVDENAEKPLDDWLMPMIYPYTDRGLENVLGVENENYEEWDFTKFVPQVIIFNIGTNDHSFTKEIPERKEIFAGKYYDFLKTLREKNPTAHIICTYGVMGTILADTENACVERFKAEIDRNIEYIPLSVQDEADGIGADWHPSETTHTKMAELIGSRVNKVFEEMGL